MRIHIDHRPGLRLDYERLGRDRADALGTDNWRQFRIDRKPGVTLTKIGEPLFFDRDNPGFRFSTSRDVAFWTFTTLGELYLETGFEGDCVIYHHRHPESVRVWVSQAVIYWTAQRVFELCELRSRAAVRQLAWDT